MFVNVLGILSSEGLVTLVQIMHNGMKVKACAGSDSFSREDKLKAHLDVAREQVERLKESPEEDIGPNLDKPEKLLFKKLTTR